MPKKRKNENSNNNNTNAAEVKIAKVPAPPGDLLSDIPEQNFIADFLSKLTVEDFIKLTQTSKYFNIFKNHPMLKGQHEFFKTWGPSFNPIEKKKYLSKNLFVEDYNKLGEIYQTRQKFFNDFGFFHDSNTKQKCLDNELSLEDYDNLYKSYLEIEDPKNTSSEESKNEIIQQKKKLLLMILNKSDDIKKFLDSSTVKFPIFFLTKKSISPFFLAARQGNLSLIYALLEYDILRYAKNSSFAVKFKNVPEEKLLNDIKKYSPSFKFKFKFREEYENFGSIKVNSTDIISYLKNKDYNLYLKALQIYCHIDAGFLDVDINIDKEFIIFHSTLEAAKKNHWEIVKFLLGVGSWNILREKVVEITDVIFNQCNDNEILKLCIPLLDLSPQKIAKYCFILLKKNNTEICSAIWKFFYNYNLLPTYEFLTQHILSENKFELMDLLLSAKPDGVDINGPVLDYLKNSKVTPEKIINMDSLVMIGVYINNYPHVLEDLLRLSPSEKISKFLTDKITEEEQKLSDPANSNDSMDEDEDASSTSPSMSP